MWPFKTNNKREKKLEELNKKFEETTNKLAERGVPFARYYRMLESGRNSAANKKDLFLAEMKRAYNNFRLSSSIAVGDSDEGAKSFSVFDSFENGSAGKRNFWSQEMYGHFYNQIFIGWQECAILKQHPIIDRACSVPAKDALTNGYTLKPYNQTRDVDDSELFDLYIKSRDEYNINQICERAITNKKVFGYSLVLPVISDKSVDMSKPFNIDGIKKGTYKGMTVIEPFWVVPGFDTDSTTDPTSLRFYQPDYYYIGGTNKKIHHSWCVKLINSEVADILKPMYFWGGVPLTQQIFERVYCADRVANEAPLLAMTKRIMVLDMFIENYVANPEEGDRTLETLTYLRDNFAVICKEPGTDVNQIDTSLSDFDSLLMTQYQLVCSIAEMPAVKLLKTQPKGFNSSGEFEDRDYVQVLMRLQNNDALPILNMHNKLLLKSEGITGYDLTVSFNPIESMTEQQRAELAEKNSLTISHLQTLGTITPEEAREFLRNSPYTYFRFLPKEMPLPDDFLEGSSKNGGASEAGNPNGGDPGGWKASEANTVHNAGGENIDAEKDPKGRYLPKINGDPA